MDETAIRRMRRKFTLAGTLSFAFVMIFMAGFIYLVNQVSLDRDVKWTLDYLVENRGELNLPETYEDSPGTFEPGGGIPEADSLRELLMQAFGIGSTYSSPEFWYSTRYFAVLYDDYGLISDVESSYIASLTEDEIMAYTDSARTKKASFGRINDYYYEKAGYGDGSSIVVFLDCTGQNAIARRLLYSAFTLIFIGSILSFIASRIISRRLVRPEIEAVERQKQFVTDVSHELKTPLSVIRADTEIIELQQGESEWTAAILRQVAHLEEMIKKLILMARSEESGARQETVDLTSVFSEAVATMEPVAQQEGKRVETSIAEAVAVRGSREQLHQLAFILMDNAIKYCDQDGLIRVSLESVRKGASFSVANTFAEGADVDCSRFFDRFYRADPARNQEKGSFGIGLSLARRIVENHGGSLEARWQEGDIIFFGKLSSGN